MERNLSNKPKRSLSLRQVRDWSNDLVLSWFRKYCGGLYSQYAPYFEEHEITGKVLISLTNESLKSMGITENQHRESILNQILLLKINSDRYIIQRLADRT